ncbi:MAG: DNA starvation/stationary phase protection protein [Proteobacteria bacterium]|nr:DNA starvation/stationary phase protection protein [Pseudomonadota bacterium]NBP16272.1 DNA starvation/stationary phase protection protein [bacterium]
MEELLNKLRVCLADTFVMYYKAHSAHWNYTGANFPQYHDFFGKIYEELFDAIDTIAEHIRSLDGMAPNSLADIIASSNLMDSDRSDKEFLTDLLVANNRTLVSLLQAYQAAEAASELGVANFIQDRINIHQKHGWMLKATLK